MMEMEMEVKDEMTLACERLQAAAVGLEMAAERLLSVEVQASASAREVELEGKLAEAERTIASLRGRKTGSTLMAKEEGSDVSVGALDAALVSLSVEQRIAVKAGLMRGGLV